jgi:hypothetical protein
MDLQTPKDLCITLKFSRTTLYRYALSGLPHIGKGRLKRFVWDEVRQWLT